MKIPRLTLAASALILSSGLAATQQQTQQSAPQQGTVASACQEDIERFCAGMEHGQGKIRACLEDNKEEVAAACRAALETTRGPGGQGQGMGRMGQGMGQSMGRSTMGRGMGHRAMQMRIMFILMDANGDRTLSLEEVQSAHARIFAHVDADKDDKVTYDEMVAFFRGGPVGMQSLDDDDDDSDQ